MTAFARPSRLAPPGHVMPLGSQLAPPRGLPRSRRRVYIALLLVQRWELMRVTKLGEFWPLYLRAHRNRYTRGAHYAGVVFGAVLAAVAAATVNHWLLVIATGGAFTMTVASHWVFEGRRPLFLINPLLGILCDLRMFVLAMTGRLEAELRRYGIGSE